MLNYEFCESPFSTEALEGAIQDSAPTWTLEVAKSNHASTLGDACERRLVYRRTIGDQAVPMVAYTRGLLSTGKLLAPIVIDTLNRFGQKQSPAWRMLEQERRPHDPQFVKLNIGCQVDSIRHVVSAEGRERPCNVVEIKTSDSNIFSRIHTPDDLCLWPWAAKYSDQLMLGMLGCELVTHPGWLVMVNKGNLYDMKILEIPFDYQRAEQLLRRAERIERHVRGGTIPERINWPSICEKCEFVHLCNPVLEGDPDAMPERLDDEELAAMLATFRETQEARDAHERIGRELKGRLVPGQRLMVGGVLVDWRRHGKGWRMSVGGEAKEGDGPPGEAGDLGF
ncbi:hypothetical protein ES708_02741 [subsurface metagenome]